MCFARPRVSDGFAVVQRRRSQREETQTCGTIFRSVVPGGVVLPSGQCCAERNLNLNVTGCGQRQQSVITLTDRQRSVRSQSGKCASDRHRRRALRSGARILGSARRRAAYVEHHAHEFRQRARAQLLHDPGSTPAHGTGKCCDRAHWHRTPRHRRLAAACRGQGQHRHRDVLSRGASSAIRSPCSRNRPPARPALRAPSARAPAVSAPPSCS